MTISAIVSWPDGIDFPIFRQRIPKLLDHVDELIICFTRHGHKDISPWIKDNIHNKKVFFVNSDLMNHHSGDWRNKSTKTLIDYANCEYVLSLEQDFLIKDYTYFFNRIKEDIGKRTEIVTFEEGNRFHPAFLLAKKSIINKNEYDFSVAGDGLDHFASVTKKLKNYNYSFLEYLGVYPGRDWFHMRGLTDNYFADKPYYDLENFYFYNDFCKSINPKNDFWVKEMERCSGPIINAQVKEFLCSRY